MSLAKQVHEYVKDAIKRRDAYNFVKANVLEARAFDIAYSESYSMNEVRAALHDGYPVLAFLKAGPQLVIGESESSLMLKGVSKTGFHKDTVLAENWTGKAIVFMGAGEEPEQVYSPEDDVIIFRPELDTWKVGHEMKADAKAKLRLLAGLPENLLPEYPVVVIFKEPDAKELKEKIKGFQAGASAYIIDPVDPLTVVLHELGHFYYKRLTAMEEDRFDELQREIKNSPPVVFDSKWSMKNGEELFCTIYMWYMKSKIVHPGYRKILGVEFAPGLEALENCFARIDNAKDELQAWKENEKRTSVYMDHVMGKAIPLKAGKRLLKAKSLPTVKEPIGIAAPRSLCEHLGETKNNEWVRVKDGLLKGRIFVLKKNGSLDYDYMRKHSATFQRVPGRSKARG